MLLALVCSIYLYKNCYKTIYLFSFFYFVLFGLMTRSKAFSICLVVLIISLIPLNDITKSIKRIKLLYSFMVSILIVLIVFLSKNYILNLVNNILNRFETTSLTTGRSYIASEYFDYFFSHVVYMVFGIGLQANTEKTGIDKSMHNGFQEILVCWGIVGIVIFLIWIFALIYEISHDNVKVLLIQIILLISIFMFLYSIQYITKPQIFITTVLYYMILRNDKLNYKKDNNYE